MKSIVSFLSILYLVFQTPTMAFAWDAEVRGDGISTNFGHGKFALVCPDKPRSSALWKPIQLTDYCYDLCADKPDSFTNGWARTRCHGHCRTANWGYKNYYKCWYKEDDPALKHAKASADEQLSRDYENYKRLTVEKHQAMANSDAWRSLRAQKEQTEKEIAALTTQKQEAESAGKILLQAGNSFKVFHNDFMARLSQRIQEYNELSQNFLGLINQDKKSIQSTQQLVRTIFNSASSPTVTLDSMNALRKEYDSFRSKQDYKSICIKRETAESLEKLRNSAAITKHMRTEYRTEIDKFNAMHGLEKTKSLTSLRNTLESNFSHISQTIAKLDWAFTPEFDRALAKPKVCQDFILMDQFLALRATGVNVRDTTHALGELSRELKREIAKIENESVKRKIVLAADNYAKSLYNNYAISTAHGRLNEMKITAKSARFIVMNYLEKLRNSKRFTETELGNLERKMLGSISRIEEESDADLAQEKLHFHARTRLVWLHSRISDLESQLESNTEVLRTFQKTLKPKLTALWTTDAFGRLLAPAYKTEKEYLDFDGKVALAESELETFENTYKGGNN